MSNTTTRYLGFCPCCGADFRVRYGVLVHHGYKRPGYGCIEGDCFGALRAPHEVSSELASEYLVYLKGALMGAQRDLAALPSRTSLVIGTGERVEKAVAPEGGYDWANDREGALKLHGAVTSWERAYRSVAWTLENQIEALGRDIARVSGLINTWAPKALRTIEEDSHKAADLQAEREAKKEAARQAKIAKAVAGYQKRIDSALRTRNTSVLAAVWEGAQRKLGDMKMTRVEALRALDRDHVWAAFGLDGLTLSSWRAEEKPEQGILNAMASKAVEWPF